MALRVPETDIKIKHLNPARSNLNHLRSEAANETQHPEITIVPTVCEITGWLADSPKSAAGTQRTVPHIWQMPQRALLLSQKPRRKRGGGGRGRAETKASSTRTRSLNR